MRLTRYSAMVSVLFCLLSSSVQADSWTTMYPSDFVHIPMPPVVSPVTWNAVGTGNGSFTSDVLDGTQGIQHLIGEMPFPDDMASTGESIPVSVNCVFHDALNKPTQTGLTPEEAAANAAQEYWKIDASEYGLMGSDTFDIESPTDLSTLYQIAPLYKTCAPWQMMNGNCNGPTTNAPENQTSFDWNAYLPMGNIQPFSTYFLQIPVRPICNPGDDCLGGLAFEMCRIRWGKNAEISNICPLDPCDENASCLYDGATSYCECNSGYEGDGFTCDEISWPTEQTCELPSGWSLISTYMDPVDPDLVQILMGLQSVASEADILDWIIIAKNYLGAAYLPQWDFNGIGDWLMGQAYQLKTTAETSLTITGTYLLPELNPINLVEGWNMVGYLRLEPADMTAVFQDITNEDNLIIAKDYLGAAYLPEYGFNGIGDMEPCQGYQVKVLQADILEYHANDEPY